MTFHQSTSQHFPFKAGCTCTASAVARPDVRVVDIQCASNSVSLAPDDARRLAVSLLSAASRAEGPDDSEWP